MHQKRRQIEAAIDEIALPIVSDIGLELVDVEFSRKGRDQYIRLFIDHSGGVTVDELQRASLEVDKAIEVADIILGRYRLEVSSPGIDRPLKKLRDFERNTGTQVKIKLFDPLPDGRRQFCGVIAGTEGDTILLDTDEGSRMTLPLDGIASAKPEIDWKKLLKGKGESSTNGTPARRTP